MFLRCKQRHAFDLNTADNPALAPFLDSVPTMESSVLAKHIEEDKPNTPTLRDYVLARFEMMITENLSKTVLETMMQQDNRERGGKTLIPTNLKQFKS